MKVDENGNLVDTNQTLVKSSEVARLLDEYGLNWKVNKVPLVLKTSGIETRFFGTVREDTNETFNCFTSQYAVFQNDELAEIVLNIAEVLQAKETNCGMFKNGAKVFMQIAMSDKYVGNDKVKRWANGLNSFDGSTSLRWGSTNLTTSCQNVYTPYYMRNDLATSIKHTTNMRDAVQRSLNVIEQLEEREKTLFEIFNKMAGKKATQKEVNETIRFMTGVDVTMGETAAKEKFSTRAINNAQALTQSIVREMSYKEQSLWGLWSGVTHYTTHEAGAEATRAESKMAGSLIELDQKVFNRLALAVA